MAFTAPFWRIGDCLFSAFLLTWRKGIEAIHTLIAAFNLCQKVSSLQICLKIRMFKKRPATQNVPLSEREWSPHTHSTTSNVGSFSAPGSDNCTSHATRIVWRVSWGKPRADRHRCTRQRAVVELTGGPRNARGFHINSIPETRSLGSGATPEFCRFQCWKKSVSSLRTKVKPTGLVSDLTLE